MLDEHWELWTMPWCNTVVLFEVNTSSNVYEHDHYQYDISQSTIVQELVSHWEYTAVYCVFCGICTCGRIWATPSQIPPVTRCVSCAGKREAAVRASGACLARGTSTANSATSPLPRTTESDTGPRELLRRGFVARWTHLWCLSLVLSLRLLATSSPCRSRRNTWCVYSWVSMWGTGRDVRHPAAQSRTTPSQPLAFGEIPAISSFINKWTQFTLLTINMAAWPQTSV